LLSVAPCSAIFLPFCKPREADLPAKRAPAEAQARLSRAHVDACRARDPEAAPSERPQAPVGVAVHRRYRLSRSRDFDAVYRQGKSVSTRFLVLYWFPREDGGDEPRLGLAVPKTSGSAVVRNRVKRQLREAWGAALPEVPVGRDYVLIARPGLSEATEQRGFEWLQERVAEVLSKAAA
jgi:ribonuclease P protein component